MSTSSKREFSQARRIPTGCPLTGLSYVSSWPGGNGITSDKVPTEIAYDTPAPSTPNTASNAIPTSQSTTSLTSSTSATETTPAAAGSSTPTASNIKWGFQFKPEESRLRCIKLFLDRNQKLPHFVSPLETAAQLRKYNRNVMDAVSDYLSQIYKHTMSTLERRYGETFMAMTKVEVRDRQYTSPPIKSTCADHGMHGDSSS